MSWELVLEHSANIAEILAGIAIVYSVFKVVPTFTRLRNSENDWSTELTKLQNSLSAHTECHSLGDMGAAALAIIETALADANSNIHIELKEFGEEIQGVIRFRKAGHLIDIHCYDERMHGALVEAFRQMAIMEGYRGRIKLADPTRVDGRGSIDLRVQVAPALIGEVFSLRVLDRESSKMPFETLGIHERGLTKLKQKLDSPRGLIICSGPTGSAKTVTLYTSLNSLDHNKRRIITVEDPVEIDLPTITQLSCSDEPGKRMQDMFGVAMHMDPDVLMIGEIKDAMTANYCYRAATTGQLVMTTASTNSSVETLTLLDNYLEDLFPRNILIVNQRLTRRLCQQCSTPMTLDDLDRQLIDNICHSAQQNPDTLADKFLEPVGCEHCEDGYRRRLAGYEMMEVTPTILAAQRKDGAQTAHDQAVSEGMTPFSFDLLRKAAKGQTTLAEINRVTDNIYAEHLV
ncbi:MAG: type IV pilus assembly protein PilB [Candidatus Azotimanducaceae bacterium]|jgi:type IV pilus assembly protein PilB